LQLLFLNRRAKRTRPSAAFQTICDVIARKEDQHTGKRQQLWNAIPESIHTPEEWGEYIERLKKNSTSEDFSTRFIAQMRLKEVEENKKYKNEEEWKGAWIDRCIDTIIRGKKYQGIEINDKTAYKAELMKLNIWKLKKIFAQTIISIPISERLAMERAKK
jgi:hypothetical protein